MYVYSANSGAACDDVANGITLRLELGRLLEHRYFVLYPADDGGYAVHFLQEARHHFGHHRQRAALHDRVRNEFLYARFAHTILALARNAISNVPVPWAFVPLPAWAAPRPRSSQQGSEGDEESYSGNLAPPPLGHGADPRHRRPPPRA